MSYGIRSPPSTPVSKSMPATPIWRCHTRSRCSLPPTPPDSPHSSIRCSAWPDWTLTVELGHGPVDLDDLIFDQRQHVKPTTTIGIDVSHVSGAQVNGDRAALDRVVANLLDNAVRHARTVVTVALEAKPTGVNLTVSDDGPGIAVNDRERVFERFTRLDDARTRATGGVGFGLAIVRDIVHAHGGTVHIEDNDPGARVCLTLPDRAS
ncbi:MAG: sensor histidine kinase [Jatrophihabitans sp.]